MRENEMYSCPSPSSNLWDITPETQDHRARIDNEISMELPGSNRQSEQNHNSKSFLFFSIFTNIQYSS